MGKKKRLRKEREKKGPTGALAAALSPYTLHSTLAVLEAASVSPTAIHRLPSVSAAFFELMKLPRYGESTADASTVTTFLDAARLDIPTLERTEDYVPPDPRRWAVVRWRQRIYRLPSSDYERPVALLDRADMLAGAVDPVLSSHLGFSLSDFVELVLTHLDDAVAAYAPVWRAAPPASPGAAAFVTGAEIAAGHLIPTLPGLVGRCSNPEAAAAALRWATVASSALRFDPLDRDSTFGSVLAVRGIGGLLVPLPSALWVEVLGECVYRLSQIAVEGDPTTEDRYAGAAARHLARLLRRIGRNTYGPVRFEVSEHVYALVWFAENTLLLIGLAAGIDYWGTQLLANHVTEDLLRISPGDRFRGLGYEGELPNDVRIVRLLVVAPPSHIAVAPVPGLAGASLDDLRWIINESAKSSDDILLFLQDLADPPNIKELRALETINAFEYWRHNRGSFSRQGRPVAAAWITPHQGDAEWYQSHERAPLEEALLGVGLKGIAAWDLVSIELGESTAVVADWPLGPYWVVDFRQRTVAIRGYESATPEPMRNFGASLAEAVRWRLAFSRAAIEDLIGSVLGMRALTITLVVTEDALAQPVVGALLANGSIELRYGRGFFEACQQDALGAEFMVGAALGGALKAAAGPSKSHIAERFLEVWKQAPQGLRLDPVPVDQVAVSLPPPRWIRPAELSRAHRVMAESLMSRNVEVGTYAGDAATRLENEHVLPALSGLLTEELSLFSSDAVLHYALVQLERCFSHRFLRDRRLGFMRGFPVLSFDPVDQASADREAAHVYERSAAIIVEQVLLQPANGNRRPDDFDWGRLMGLAQLVLESGLRSETHHYGLRRLVVEIGEDFDVIQREESDAQVLDFAAFQHARVEHTLPAAPGDSAPADDTPRRLLEVRPELGKVDEALTASMGFGIEALFHVLWIIRTWPLATSVPIARVTAGEIVTRCGELGSHVKSQQLEAAVEALTINRQRLVDNGPVEHWEQERRPIRLATNPLVAPSIGEVIACPWMAEGTWRLLGHRLNDGRLLWPDSALQAPVVDALREYRHTLNTALEREMVLALVERGFRARGPIRRPREIGLAAWHGEIDAIAISERRNTIWVLEAKDVAPRFSPATIERSIRDFHERGGYVDKLLAKAAAVETNPRAVASALGVQRAERSWTVRPLMVTRRVEPAAFYRASKVQFCTVDRVADSIDTSEL